MSCNAAKLYLLIWAAALVARTGLGFDLNDLPPGQWVHFPTQLLDTTPDAAYGGRGWNKLVLDPVNGRFYQWEGWAQMHPDPAYGFPYTPRPYHIYSSMLVRFSVPESIQANGLASLEMVELSCWAGSAGTGFTLRNPALDHPKMKTPHPTDRHPYGTMVYDPVRQRFWQWGGVNNGVVPTDTWYFDIATKTWSERFPLHSPPSLVPAHAVYLPEQDSILMLTPNGGNWLEMWLYDIAGNDWKKVDAFSAFGLAGYQQALVYDPSRKRVHFFTLYDHDGNGTRDLARFSYDPAAGTFTVAPPALFPAGYGQEIVYDAKRDRLVCLKPALRTEFNETWAYDFGTNAFSKLNVGGSPPGGIGDITSWQLCRDEARDLYVVFRSSGDLYVLKPLQKNKRDFSGDGKADLLFRHPSNGEVVLWLMQ